MESPSLVFILLVHCGFCSRLLHPLSPTELHSSPATVALKQHSSDPSEEEVLTPRHQTTGQDSRASCLQPLLSPRSLEFFNAEDPPIPVINYPKGPSKPYPQTGHSQWRGTQSAHQVDKILVADLAVGMAVGESQEYLPLVWVQLGTVAVQEAPELACTDEACVPRVTLRERYTQQQGQRGSVPRSARPQVLHHCHHSRLSSSTPC